MDDVGALKLAAFQVCPQIEDRYRIEVVLVWYPFIPGIPLEIRAAGRHRRWIDTEENGSRVSVAEQLTFRDRIWIGVPVGRSN